MHGFIFIQIRAANDDDSLLNVLEDEDMAGYLHKTGYCNLPYIGAS